MWFYRIVQDSTDVSPSVGAWTYFITMNVTGVKNATKLTVIGVTLKIFYAVRTMHKTKTIDKPKLLVAENYCFSLAECISFTTDTFVLYIFCFTIFAIFCCVFLG